MPTDRLPSEADQTVFKPSVPEGHEWVMPVADREERDTVELLCTVHAPVDVATWPTPRLELLKRAGNDQRNKRAAMPWPGSHVLILRDEAVDSVGPILAPHGNLLPLLCSEARLVVFIAPLLAGALDEARSELVRFSSGRIMKLIKPEFVSHAIGDVAAFRLAEMPRGSLFLTGDLVEQLRATGDTSGTDYRQVWP